MRQELYIEEENLHGHHERSSMTIFFQSIMWSLAITLPFWISALYYLVVSGGEVGEEIKIAAYYTVSFYLVLVPAVYEQESEKDK